MNSTFIKGLIMTVVAFLSAALSTQLPTGSVNWPEIGITTLGIVLAYFAKNMFISSNSEQGTLNLKDFLSGAIMAISGAISSLISTQITIGSINWNSVGVTALVVFLGYLSKNLATDSTLLKK